MPDENSGGTNQSSQDQNGQSQQTGGQGGGSNQTQQSNNSSTSTAPARPDWVPETCFDPQNGVVLDAFGKHYAEKIAPVLTAHAAEQVRLNSLPSKPEDVKIELPKEFKLPQGVEFKLDPAKPEYGKVRELAVKHRLSQDAVTDLMGVYAETLVGSEQAIATAKKAELDKLGSNAQNRVAALETWFTGMVGEDGAKQLKSMLVTAGIVSTFEKLVAKYVGQGVAPFGQNGREPPAPAGRKTEAEVAKMTPAQKLDYVRQFDQSKMPEWRDPRAA